MKTRFKIDGVTASFVFTEVEPAYHDALLGLYYMPYEDGFAKHFPANTPNIDQIYRQFECSAEVMLQQAAGKAPVPWEDVLAKFVERIAGHTIDWYLVGSTALALRGIDITPGDVDLITSAEEAEQLEILLRDCRIEPLQRSEGWIWRSFGRVFLGGRLEWVGGVNDGADHPHASDFGPVAQSRLEVVRWRGIDIRVPPLDLQLAVNERRGRFERAAKIRQYVLMR